MNKLISSVTLLCLLAAAAMAQEATTNAPAKAPAATADTNAPIKITSKQVKDHVRAKAIVTGKVAEVNKAASLTRLNFDQPFPDQSFTAIIFNKNTNRFSNLEGLKGKQVEVNGKITLFRNHPEIVLESTNQLRVLDSVPAGDQK